MSEPTHPPIPPNNDRFRTREGVDEFACYGYINQPKPHIVWSPVDALPGLFNKRNCRNEARSAWLDEAARLTWLSAEDCAGPVCARANASAWAEWGRQ